MRRAIRVIFTGFLRLTGEETMQTGKNSNQVNQCKGGLLTGLLLCLMVSSGWSDIIQTRNGDIEGRILEDSARVMIVETVAGEYVAVQKAHIQSIQKEPVADFYYRRGAFHEQKGSESLAMLDYLEALNLDPEHQMSKQRIQDIQYEKKRATWEQGIDRAHEHLANQEYRQALVAFQDVLRMNPDDSLAQRIVQQMSDTHTRLAYLFYDHCYDQEAILELAKAEELNPDSAEIYFVLGIIHENRRMFDQARLEYERALQLNPEHSSARSQLAQLIERTRGRVIQ